MSTDEIKTEIAGLQRQLRSERDQEQVVLLQLDLATARKQLAEAEKANGL